MVEPGRRWWIAPSVLLGVFFVLLWQVAAHGFVTRLDVHVRDAIQGAAQSSRPGWLGWIGRGCADLGDEQLALACLVLVTGYVGWRRRSWRPVVPAAWALAVLASVIPLKIWVGRPGPGDVVLGNANLGFFPSGHTADALCCYGMSAFLLCVFVWPGHTFRLAMGGTVALLLSLTIFGLLWSNYHWLSDVIGSLCWCGAWLLVIARYSSAAGSGWAGTRGTAAAEHAPARL